MWNPFSRKNEDDDDRDLDIDLADDDLVDAVALRIIARWVAEHDGLQANGAMVDRMFVVGSAPH
jgi:hypothetical protein